MGNGRWNIPALRRLLEEMLPNEAKVDDFEISHGFDPAGPQTILINARHLSTNASNEPLIILAIEDVTLRRSQEESLAARATILVKADRSKDEFLAMLAHELRNPLAPLRNAAEILKSPGGSAEVRKEAHDVLARQIENMSRMLDDLLDVSRITEGRIELRKEVVSLDTVVSAAASLARAGCEAHGQALAITLPAEPIFLNADATRLDQVFGNLLGNACKYSGPGSLITLSAERSSGEDGLPMVTLRVRDNGMGIAPDVLPRIFDLFVQATRSLDRSHGGLGIGLTLVQRIVSLHGGSVEARSEGLGKGSEFIIKLPIASDVIKLPSAVSVGPDADIPRRLLIVDDNKDSADTMAMLQEMLGHETSVAYSGLDALTAAKTFHPDVILLDIGLPGLNGFEVARHLRALPEFDGVLLIALSGYGSDADRAMAKDEGFDHYLVKPPDLDLLRKWIAAHHS